VVDSPSVLEQQIGAVRRQATTLFLDAHSQVHGVVSRWIDIEHAVERRVRALASPDESFTPALLYVGVATLSGSVLARGRGLFCRTTVPPVLLVLSLNHFLPKTTHNLRTYGGELEERYFPTFSEKHAIGQAHALMAWEQTKESWHNGVEKVEAGAGRIFKMIEETTGLKVAEALGAGRTLVKKTEVEVASAVHDIAHKAQEKADDVIIEAHAAAPEAVKASKAGDEKAKRLV